MHWVGKFLTEKPIHVNSLQNALSGIWCNPKGLRIEEKGPKIFQFYFDDESDAKRLLNGTPWIFCNSWLSLQPWERNKDIDDMNFSSVPLKIQIWGLPPHCRTIKMGCKIEACLGEVNKADGVLWADFQYERFPQYCYTCGLIGHDEEYCMRKTHPNTEEATEECTLGPWLRASQPGRKVRESPTHQPPNYAYHQNKRSGPLPKEFLDLLSSLSVNSQSQSTGNVRLESEPRESVLYQETVQSITSTGASERVDLNQSKVDDQPHNCVSPLKDKADDKENSSPLPDSGSLLKCITNT
ncbi:Zinc knuckle CX2CX4HX4C [Sesbania bispinosa]|nr:Zinc knuckle CX2CX4HX4C [Sesbania bispinosa]